MTTSMVKREVTSGGQSFPYQIYAPPQLQTPAPTILYLHGVGESGNDGQKMTANGLGLALQKSPESWPFLVIFPQKPTRAPWEDFQELLCAVITQTQNEFRVDTGRTYFTGISQGGAGVLHFADQLPLRPAAIGVNCGFGNPHAIHHKLKETPVRLYHGMRDEVVAYENTIALAKEMSLHGSTQAEVILYPDAGHNCWDLAYQKSDLSNWFQLHSLKGEQGL